MDDIKGLLRFKQPRRIDNSDAKFHLLSNRASDAQL